MLDTLIMPNTMELGVPRIVKEVALAIAPATHIPTMMDAEFGTLNCLMLRKGMMEVPAKEFFTFGLLPKR